MPPEPLTDAERLDAVGKQVDRYSAVVARLAGNQVQAKTWCVTSLAALAALAVNNTAVGPLLVGLGALVAFASLDSYYLGLERYFRDEARDAVGRLLGSREPDWASEMAFVGPTPEQRRRKVLEAAGSLLRSPFYIGLCVLLGVGCLALAG